MPDFCRFGLIVTGEGEEEFLPKLFRAVMSRANCAFVVLRRVGQLSPITSPKRILKIVGSGKRLPTKDENIGLAALHFLRQHPRSYVMIVDDLEGDRRDRADHVFARYRTALDEVLGPPSMKSRAAVHFLANMLEAYYFADFRAVNSAAGADVLAADHPTDVEQIRHPKNDLKRLWPGFDEKKHGKEIVGSLDIEHVLSRPKECCWLRTMFAWCVAKLSEADVIHDSALHGKFCLPEGDRAPTTTSQ